MGIFLVDEGTVAVGLIAAVFTIGLLGVGALGWYVVRCDAENRHAERELLMAEGRGTVPGSLAETHSVAEHHSAPAEAESVLPAPAADGSPTVPHRRRKGH